MSQKDVTPVLGGLVTNLPPLLLTREQSPDLLNVINRNGEVRKRGGFTPLFKDRMVGDALQTQAWKTVGSTSSGVETNFYVQPGHLIAGHREAYSDGNPALTIALWFKPTTLISQQGGNGLNTGTPYSPSPFTVRVQPIISKGPVKKSDQTTAVTAANEWGTDTNSGMPFCIYLYNSGTGTSPSWTFRLSAHVKVAGTWTLQTVTSSVIPQAGRRYHIIGAASGSRVALRIALVREGTDPVYVEDQVTFTGTLGANLCPIQVLDCPQLFVTGAPTPGSATLRPGLNINSAASGGYWYGSLRPEATVDDISIWLGDRTLSTMERRTRVTFTGQSDLLGLWNFDGGTSDYVEEKTGRGNHLYLVPRGPIASPKGEGREGGHWFFNGSTAWAQLDVDGVNARWASDPVADCVITGEVPGINYREVNVIRNTTDQILMPDDILSVAPAAGDWIGKRIWLRFKWTYPAGSFRTTSGRVTAHTKAVVAGQQVNYLTLTDIDGFLPFNAIAESPLSEGTGYTISGGDPAPMYALVRDNMAHGLAVEFWPDAIEPRWAQTLAEWSSVMRIDINTSGKVEVYVRDGAVTDDPQSATEVGENYQLAVTSTSALVPGRRYHIAAVRRSGGAAVDLYFDGVIDTSGTGLHPSTYSSSVSASRGTSHPPGGLMVAHATTQRLIAAAAPLYTGINRTFQVNTNPTSGFCGRIESLKLLCGPTAATLIARHGPESDATWRFTETLTYKNVVNDRRTVEATDSGDAVRPTGRGTVVDLSTQRYFDAPIGNASAQGSGKYTISAPTFDNDQPNSLDGHYSVDGVFGHAHYVFGLWTFDTDGFHETAMGAYSKGWEWRYLTGGVITATQTRHPFKYSHLQLLDTPDQVGFYGSAVGLCDESDLQDDSAAAIAGTAANVTTRQRPYQGRSPYEIGPQWTTGLARPASGAAAVSLVGTYDIQTDQRRLGLAACGRTVYWAKPQWDGGRLLFAGGQGSHVYCAGNVANGFDVSGSGTKTVKQMTAWLRPYNLSGKRMIAAARIIQSDVNNEKLISWMVYADNGAITVVGCEDATKVWRFQEGTIGGVTTDVLRQNSLKVGAWNHLCVIVGATTVTCYVNGQRLAMVNTNSLTGAEQTDAWGSGSSVTPIDEFYIGGSPDDAGRIELPFSGGTRFTIDTESWHGNIVDVHLRNSANTARYSGAVAFVPPMFTADASDTYWWRLDEGTGWLLANNGSESAYDAEARIREFVPIATGMRWDANRYYSQLVFRDDALISNGAEYPFRLHWNGLTKPSLWTASRIGMAAPTAIDIRTSATVTAGATYPVGIYLVWMTYVNDAGQESEPTQLTSYTTAATSSRILLNLKNVPRSIDPQVVKRRFYVSPTGGGLPVFNRDLDDNVGTEIDLDVYGATGTSPTLGVRLPAPRGRRLAIAGQALVIADLTDPEAGQNAFAFSTPSDIDYFTTASTVVIDSEDGKPIIGVGHNLGQAFFSKRDSIHMLGVGALVDATQVDAAVRLVQASDGIGGGIAPANNLLYGGGDRGIFVFDNTNMQCLSDAIEPTWRVEIDRTDLGLYLQRGAFWRSFSQYWTSVRRDGQTVKDTMLVLDIKTGQWDRLLVPQHLWMGMVEVAVGKPKVVIGTLEGKILGYNDDVLMDTADDEAIGKGAVTISASSGLSGTAARMTVSGARFPQGLAGLQGATVTVVHDGITEVATVAANGLDWLEWASPMTGWTSYTSFTIGAYSGYWTSTWMADAATHIPQNLHNVSVTCTPLAGTLRVDVASIVGAEPINSAWPSGFESLSFDMSRGFTVQPLLVRERNNGVYHRLRFGTYGSRDPFRLIGYALDVAKSRTQAQTGRTS